MYAGIAIVVLAVVAFLIWQYRQSVDTNDFLQQDAALGQDLQDLLAEKKPTYVRKIGAPRVWTSKAVAESDATGSANLLVQHKSGDVFRITVRDYLRSLRNATDSSRMDMIIRNSAEIAEGLGIASVIEDKTRDARGLWLSSVKPDIYMVGLEAPTYSLRRVIAEWAVIIPTEGSVYITVSTPSNSNYLPADSSELATVKIWDDSATRSYPLLSEVKYTDLVARPGMMLFIPAHWYFSIRGKTDPAPPSDDDMDDGLPVSMGLVGYLHSPVSRVISALSTA